MGVVAKQNAKLKKELELIGKFYELVLMGRSNSISYIDDETNMFIEATECGEIIIKVKDRI